MDHGIRIFLPPDPRLAVTSPKMVRRNLLEGHVAIIPIGPEHRAFKIFDGVPISISGHGPGAHSVHIRSMSETVLVAVAASARECRRRGAIADAAIGCLTRTIALLRR